MSKIIYISRDIIEDLHEAFLERASRLDPEEMKCDWLDLYEYIIHAAVYASVMIQENHVSDDTASDYMYSEIYARIIDPAATMITLKDVSWSRKGETSLGTSGMMATMAKRLLREVDYGYYRGIARELSEMPEVIEVFREIDRIIPAGVDEVADVDIRDSRVKIKLVSKRPFDPMKLGNHKFIPHVSTSSR